MDKTIKYDRKCDWWNGRVVIDEIKVYSDSRGMVAETFRIDDVTSIESKMCYISETKPFVLRGPHEHESQRDSFVSWKTVMVYQMYNKETKEMKYYVTNPNTITRVIVDIGIVHSYRNLSLETANTLNFPDQLFMGEDKKGYKSDVKIDEIRHEEEIKPTKTIWILGANGRLGKALTDQLYADMGYHNYHVIPIYEHFENNKSGITKLNKLLDSVISEPNSIVVNCIAKTNVQNSESSDYMYSNFFLPKYLTEFALKTKTVLIHFSTDYIYQQGLISEYTKSKKEWESWLNEQLIQQFADFSASRSDIEQYVKVIRLANLFSQNGKDTHNILNKIFSLVKNEKPLTVPPDLKIMPTDVSDLAIWFSERYIQNIEKYYQFVNISGKPYTFKELLEFINIDGKIVPNGDPEVINNPDIFLDNPSYVGLNCDVAIKRKMTTIIEESKSNDKV